MNESDDTKGNSILHGSKQPNLRSLREIFLQIEIQPGSFCNEKFPSLWRNPLRYKPPYSNPLITKIITPPPQPAPFVLLPVLTNSLPPHGVHSFKQRQRYCTQTYTMMPITSIVHR